MLSYGEAFSRVPGQALSKAGGLPPIRTGAPSGIAVRTGNATDAAGYAFLRGMDISNPEKLHQPYRNSVWVQAAIKKVSGPVASVKPCIYPPTVEVAGVRSARTRSGIPKGRLKKFHTSRGMVRRQEDDEIEIPALNAFLRSPMQGLGYSDFIEASIGWIKMAGECFWLLDDRSLMPFPSASDSPTQVVCARPDRMREIVGPDDKLTGWQFTDRRGRIHALLPEQVIQVRCWNPYSDFRGLSEYEAAHIAAESDWLAGKFKRNLMANNGDTGPFIIAKTGIPDDVQREQILTDLRAKREAQQRGTFRPVFLTGDIEVEDPKVRAVDAAYIASRTEDHHEVFIGFGVPPSMADVKAAYSIGSASDFYQLITCTCIPAGEKVCDGLERLTAKLFAQQVEILLDWDEHPVMQEVRKERMASIDPLWSKGMPMQQIDEALGLELPDYPGKEIGYLPLNIVPVGSPELEAAPAPENDPALSEQNNPTPVQDPIGEMMRVLVNRPRNGQRAASRRALWSKHMRRRQETVRVMQSRVSRELMKARASVLQKLENLSAHLGKTPGSEAKAENPVTRHSLVDVIFDAKKFGEELFMSVSPVIDGALQTAATQLRKDELGLDDPWKFPPAKALEFIQSRKQKVQDCGEDVRSQLNTSLSEGYEAGETADELAKRAKGVFNQLTHGEAKRIAITETGNAFSFSRHEAMVDAGIEYKTWLCSHTVDKAGNSTSREGHENAEERYQDEPIPVDVPFEVVSPDGDMEQLMYPLDGSLGASAGNIINCHCVQLAAQKQEEDEKSVVFLIHGLGRMRFWKN